MGVLYKPKLTLTLTPARISLTPRTRREKYSVVALRFSWVPTYSKGRTKLAAESENMTPATREMTGGEVLVSVALLQRCCLQTGKPRTSLGKVEVLLAEIRDQANQRRPPPRTLTTMLK